MSEEEQNTASVTRQKLIIIAGPTASGKSALSVELAKRIGGSVISADSMQVYRGMDIGTAKITREQMQGIPHYLIDVLDPHEEWNVVLFQAKAREAIRDIAAQGRVPIVCGGTGFYIQALVYNIDFTPMAEDASYRQKLADYAAEKGNEALLQHLAEVDPEEAAQLHPNNLRRMIRAMEYYHQSGRKISEHNARERLRKPYYDTSFFVLSPERSVLYERIDRRVDRMMEEGLAKEVRRLKAQGLTQNDLSMQGLGYRQILDALDGKCTMEEAVAQIKLQTRHFAKRQLTWFRRERGCIWIDPLAYPDTGALADYIAEKLTNRAE